MTNHDDNADADRRLLLNVAYRLLGSVTDAEDAVQETYVRWYRLSAEQRRDIVSPPAWMVRVIGRVCLDMLGSARRRRERYVGEWLPEPVPGDGVSTSQRATAPTDDPADRVTLDESVSMALLVVLESMTPAERVAFVLHDVFGHSFADIAEVVGRSVAACRQLATSARRRVRSARAPTGSIGPPPPIVAAFKSAWESGDVERLVPLLDPSVTAVADGGGVVGASPRPVRGAESVARLLIGVRRNQPDLSVDITPVNGTLGLIARADERVMAVISLTVSGGRVDHVWAMRNPAKLSAWARPTQPNQPVVSDGP